LDDQESIDAAVINTGANNRATASGCTTIMLYALLSCLFLFLNGGLTMALINALGERGHIWVNDDRITQFVVLIGPVFLLIIQWSMIDYLKTHLQRRRAV
jgi:hypothetical protein